MLNRVLVVVAIIVGFGLAGVIGYAFAGIGRPLTPHTETSSEPSSAGTKQQPVAELPQVFEKNIPSAVAFYTTFPERQEACSLRFQVVAGNRVEGEVAVSESYDIGRQIVKDPYGNVILQSITTIGVGGEYYITSANTHPWRFAFIAATTGEYSVEAIVGYGVKIETPIVAHIKVTVYDK
jgi:hypothetical protein